MNFAIVSLDPKSGPSRLLLSYRIPRCLDGRLKVGSCVLVPLGARKAIAYVVSITDKAPDLPEGTSIKNIREILFDEPLFTERTVSLARKIAEHYQCPLGEALQLFIPSGWERSLVRHLTIASVVQTHQWLKKEGKKSEVQKTVLTVLLNLGGSATVGELIDLLEPSAVMQLGRALSQLKRKGLIREEREVKVRASQPRPFRAVRISEKGVQHLRSLEEEDAGNRYRLLPKQKALLWHLSDGLAVPTTDLTDAGFTDRTIRSLEKKGLIEMTTHVPDRTWDQEAEAFSAPDVRLTNEQERAVSSVVAALQRRQTQPGWGRSEGERVFLLHGVTASGKTEVYLRCVGYALSAGMGCIYLVPEIALTAQIVGILRSRFGERVAVWHSALPPSSRFQQWQKVREGKCPVVVGARSALFAPVANLGLIVIDEEHDHSYKQDRGTRYHAVEVARMRAAQDRSVIVMGSATPSLTSYYRALQGLWNLLELSERVEGKPLPTVRIIDERTASHRWSPIFSDSLYEAMGKALATGHQVILFLNRRGYARVYWCEECGYHRQCQNCAVNLVYHSRDDRLHCHHCGHREKPEGRCPLCGSAMMVLKGYGTEQVATEVRRLFPQHPIALLDRDAVVSRGDHARILSAFRAGHAQVLVGTQMVTKGLDFPQVTVVGVLDADQSLLFPHFRAAEETFQLLTQVAGRAGRGDKPGHVFIQTRLPDHYAIRLAIEQDFKRFFFTELQNRKSPPYPPYSVLAELIVADEDNDRARQSIEEVSLTVRKAIARLSPPPVAEALGPTECLIPRLRGRWRYHLLLRSRKTSVLRQVLSVALPALSQPTREILTVDIDPLRLE